MIETPEDLYHYYMAQPLPLKEEIGIKNDLHRSDPGNDDWLVQYKTGKNSLYNTLAALFNWDLEIGYAQGMNIVLSWILKFTSYATGEIDPVFGHQMLFFDEATAFYVFVHINQNLKYRKVFDKKMSKCIEHLEFLQKFL